MGRIRDVIVWLSFLILISKESSANVTPLFVFDQLEFEFPNNDDKQAAAVDSDPSYIMGNSNPFAIEVWNTKLFITVPRWLKGSGPTLNYVNIDSTNSSPKLMPYPNYEKNDISAGNYDDKFVSVFGIRVDEHDRLWFVESGLSEIRDRGIRLASPKLHIYDLKTDTLINTVVLTSRSRPRSIFLDLAVDTDPKNSENTFAYIADTRTFALIVYNFKTNELYRIENNYFHIDSRYGNFVYKGIRYQWPDGITGLGISHMYPDGYKTLFFHSLASLSEYAVSTETLQDKLQYNNFSKYIHLGDRGESGQSSAESLDVASGVIFFTQIQKNSVGCWNSFTSHEYTDATVGTVVDGLEYPNHLTIDFNHNIWILENNLPYFLYGNNSRIFSYKISRIPVSKAIQGTICFSDEDI